MAKTRQKQRKYNIILWQKQGKNTLLNKWTPSQGSTYLAKTKNILSYGRNMAKQRKYNIILWQKQGKTHSYKQMDPFPRQYIWQKQKIFNLMAETKFITIVAMFLGKYRIQI